LIYAPIARGVEGVRPSTRGHRDVVDLGLLKWSRRPAPCCPTASPSWPTITSWWASNGIPGESSAPRAPPSATSASPNLPPRASSTPPSAPLNLSATDPGAVSISHWTINWGDGSAPQVVAGNPSSVTHVYGDGPNNWTISATATDRVGTYSASNTAAITVNPAVTLSTATLPAATANVFYDQTITASGGTGAITLTVSDLQNAIAGLTIAGTGTGSLAISGTPTVAGTEAFTLTATDAAGGTTGPISYSVTGTPAGTLTLKPLTLGPDAVGSSFGPIALGSSGGFGAYTFTLAKGNTLPPGLALDDGSVIGTPTMAGAFVFTIVATGNHSPSLTGQLKCTMTVTPALAVSPTKLSVATGDDKINTQLTATGGSGKGYVFAAASLPSWLTLSTTGLLNGTPPATTASPLNFTVTVTDSNSVSRTFNYALTVDPALNLSPNSLPIATVGDKFSTQLAATGGSGASYSFKGVSLPAWLTLSSAGLLSGTPPATAGASSSFMVTVTDSLKSLTVDSALTVSPGSLSMAAVGISYSTQLTATGGSGRGYTFTGINLPAWLTLSDSGLLSGTPTTATGSPFRFTVAAADGNGGAISQVYSLAVNSALTINPGSLPAATVGVLFSTQLTVMGGSGSGFAFTGSSLPTWLTLSSAGLLSGTPPTAAGSPFSFPVTATDSNGDTVTVNLELAVNLKTGDAAMESHQG
jgi:large repetitive protein